MSFSYEYPRPAVTVDAILLSLEAAGLEVLLIERGHAPFAGAWALPGGFVDQDEALDLAVRRELEEETGLRVATLEQIGAYGDPGRDPRGHTVGVAFLCALPREETRTSLRAGDDARRAEFHPLDALPPLAFDHDRMIRDALVRLSTEGRSRALVGEALGSAALELLDRARI
jgi:8-oxo-dGTP diphosphatase